jgi:hypothetical protein
VSYCNSLGMRALAAALLTLSCCLFLAAEELRICPKCGFECPADSTKCTHCEAPLSGKGPAEPSRPPEEISSSGPSTSKFTPAGKLESLGVETVNELAKTDPDSGRMDALKKHIQQCNKLSAALQQECPVCAGGTKSRIKVSTMGKEGRFQDVASRICPRCNGSKFIVRPQTIAQWKEASDKAQAVFAEKEQARKFASVAGAWVPKELSGKLTVSQRAALAQVILAECPDCSGLGFVDCATCQGLGEVKCSAQGCELGQVTIESTGQMVKGKVVRTEDCPACKGTGAASCSDCKGAGKIKCKKCAGSGQAPVCKKCDGAMLVDCRKCKGTGTVKDQPCAECSGEGKMLCPACAGANPR